MTASEPHEHATASGAGVLTAGDTIAGANESVEPLRTKNVVLDTQSIYAENFKYESRKLTELKEHVAAGRIRLFMTDINEREVRAGIRKRVAEAVEALSTKVRRGARILSNLPGEYDLLFDPAKEQDVVTRLLGQFDQFLTDAKVQIISSRDLTVGPIFDRYFDAKAPFEATGEKKSEFPDAVSVGAVVEWAETQGEDVYLVSGDEGVRRAAEESPRVHPVGSLADVLARATVTYKAERIRQMAHAAYHAVAAEIRSAVEGAFLELEFTWRDYDYGNPDVIGVSIEDMRLSQALLTDIEENIALFELEAAASYEAELRYDDPDSVTYDREDDHMYVFNRIHAEARARIIVPVTVSVEFDHETGEGQVLDVEVNNGREVSVVPDELLEVGSDMDDEWRRAEEDMRS